MISDMVLAPWAGRFGQVSLVRCQYVHAAQDEKKAMSALAVGQHPEGCDRSFSKHGHGWQWRRFNSLALFNN
jgi:hypothetical protein